MVQCISLKLETRIYFYLVFVVTGKIVQSTLEECRDVYAMWIGMVLLSSSSSFFFFLNLQFIFTWTLLNNINITSSFRPMMC